MKNFLAGRIAVRRTEDQRDHSGRRIEESMPKERILELYLNEIFLGQNSFGVTAAAQTYFNKPLSDLTAVRRLIWLCCPKPLRAITLCATLSASFRAATLFCARCGKTAISMKTRIIGTQ